MTADLPSPGVIHQRCAEIAGRMREDHPTGHPRHTMWDAMADLMSDLSALALVPWPIEAVYAIEASLADAVEVVRAYEEARPSTEAPANTPRPSVTTGDPTTQLSIGCFICQMEVPVRFYRSKHPGVGGVYRQAVHDRPDGQHCPGSYQEVNLG